MDKRIKAAAA